MLFRSDLDYNMATFAGSDTYRIAKRDIVQNGLIFHFDAAYPNTITNTLFKNLVLNKPSLYISGMVYTAEYGGSLYDILNGSTDAVIGDTNDEYLLYSGGSICAWISTTANGRIIGKAIHSNPMAGAIWDISIVADGFNGQQPGISCCGARSSVATFTLGNVWHYVCGTWGTGTTTIYKNGNFLTSAATSFGAQQQAGQVIRIGSAFGWNGIQRYAMIKIYNQIGRAHV